MPSIIKSLKTACLLCLILTLSTQAQEQFPYKLTKVFETNGFEGPESVVKDSKNKVLYVSNVNGQATEKNGKGYISKVALDGQIIKKKWITGLHAPKGMAIRKGKLYVSDIDAIIAIDIATGNKKRYPAAGATFLNDIAIAKNGDVYASNSFGFSGIYKLSKGVVSLWKKGATLEAPNGLIARRNNLLVASWGTHVNPNTFATKTLGRLYTINLKTKTMTDRSKPFGNLDGYEKTKHGYFVTDWLAGKLFYIDGKNNNTISMALDLPQGSADLHFDKKSKIVYIPLMLNGTLRAYQLSK